MTADASKLLPDDLERQARACLDASIMKLDGEPIGTVAARDDRSEPVNYHHCFVRDFFVSALVFLADGRPQIVRNFLELLVDLESQKSSLDCFDPGRGLMPASFAVGSEDGSEVVQPDFGEQAIARVTPIDSGFWWILLLRAYTHYTGDRSLVDEARTQRAIELIVEFSLDTRVEMLPTLLVPDGAYMIDRRMGVYGHPLDVQVLFFASLRAAREMLPDDHELVDPIDARIGHLTFQLRTYYWIDLEALNRSYRYPVEEFGTGVRNHYNLYPEAIPRWLLRWLPDDAGYFVANLGPGRVDHRFMAVGNLMATITNLCEDEHQTRLSDLFEERWDDLIGHMPMKLCYPALVGREWEIVTGHDAKNRPWSYHNGGSWPCLLWLLTASCVHTGHEDRARRAIELAARRVGRDDWPEYYDTRQGRLVGRKARLRQTWTAAGLLAAVHMLDDPSLVDALTFDEPVRPGSVDGTADLSRRADPGKG